MIGPSTRNSNSDRSNHPMIGPLTKPTTRATIGPMIGQTMIIPAISPMIGQTMIIPVIGPMIDQTMTIPVIGPMTDRTTARMTIRVSDPTSNLMSARTTGHLVGMIDSSIVSCTLYSDGFMEYTCDVAH